MEKQIIAYRIEQGFGVTLGARVGELIPQGWQPYGNAFCNDSYCYQPLVKYATSTSEKDKDCNTLPSPHVHLSI